MRDLQNPKAIWLKAVLFVFLGLASAALILAELPNWRVAGLLALAIWSFCRAYYFAFYVVERYLDPSYRFSGLLSLGRYLLRRKT
jgi:hypothetical protein